MKTGNLLKSVLAAHGGLQNWAKVTRVTAHMSLGGPFWAARGWPDVYSKQTVTIDPHREHITFAPFPAADRMSVLEVGPERVAITTLDGQTVEERLNPRESFPAEFVPASTPWDAIQVAYFTSAAVWNYLTHPFVFTQPGVETNEITPWTEGAQIWRRLAVKFPKTLANHNADQIFYYDDAFMQRRMDYSPDVTGNPPVAHYIHDHRTFGGFVFPTRRLVHLHDANGVANQQFAPITIDVAAVRVEMDTPAFSVVRTTQTAIEADLLITTLRHAGLHPLDLETASHFSLAGADVGFHVEVPTTEVSVAKEFIGAH